MSCLTSHAFVAGQVQFCFVSFLRARLPLFEISRVLVRLDHVACFIVNANHSIAA